jgi:thioesterase domain-containing protein/aryl carrier-like protein
VPIGRPIANTKIYLLDAQRQPVPLGATGEIWIGGPGVARGYLNQPALTAQRFVADPFSSDPDARLYRSGDLGRWLPDGTLDYLGRNDGQVKIRGFRIELGEIEARLAACEGVRQAVVLAREDRPGDKRLVAYYQQEHEAGPEAAGLRRQLAEVLPDYMLPAAFVRVQAWPLTPNGKLDRSRLPQPDVQAPEEGFEAPRGALETAVAEVWCELLQCERIDRRASFFELGGHSLLAIRMLARLREKTGAELALRALYANPTLAQLAAGIEAAARGEAAHPNLVALRPAGTKRPLYFVHAGEGDVGYVLQLLPALDPEVPVYGIAASGLAPGETAGNAVVAMARQYVAAIRTVQPHGPYRLAGWSAGGTIAYEMANQLLGLDESVEFIGLIDTTSHYASLASLREGAGTVSANGGAAARIGYLMQLVPADAAPEALAGLVQLADAGDVDGLLLRCQQEGWLPAGIPQDELRRHLDVRVGLLGAVANYPLAPLALPVHLFCAAEGEPEAREAGWKRLLGERLRAMRVAGSHYSMVEAPRAHGLATAIAAALESADGAAVHAEHRYAPRIVIQHGRSGVNPLFVVPGAGANVTAFFELAGALGSHVPVYGLQPRGLCGTLAPHTDVPAAARAYVKAVREIAPDGPYRLLGHSFGGWVAFEMARQLQDAGDEVTLVVVDSRPPRAPHTAGQCGTRVQAVLRLVQLLEMRAGCALGITAQALAGLDHEAQVALLLARAIAVKLLPMSTKASTVQGILRVFETNVNTHYAPASRYRGTLFYAAAGNTDSGTYTRVDTLPPDLAPWTDHASELSAWTGPGNHMTMLERPHAVALADWLSSLLGTN